MKKIVSGSSYVSTRIGKDVETEKGKVYVPKYSTGLIIDAFYDHGIQYLLVEFDGFGDECVTEWYSKNQLNL